MCSQSIEVVVYESQNIQVYNNYQCVKILID